MKVDELLKYLENIKINEDEINKNIGKKCKIVGYLAQILNFDDSLLNYLPYRYIMTRDNEIYKIKSYKSYGISPNNAYAYVNDDYFTGYYPPSDYYYPFLRYEFVLLHAYLSKIGLEDGQYYVAPATGLKYVTILIRFTQDKRVVIEVADIDTVATNLNFPMLVHNILGTKLGTKYIDGDKIYDIVYQLDKQKFFGGYTFNEAWEIVNNFYGGNNASLAKDVVAIRNAYTRIFKPFRIIYDLNTKQFIV